MSGSHLDLPSNLDPASPEFIPALNDALRRLAGQTGATTTKVIRIGGSAPGGGGGGSVAEGYNLIAVSDDNHATPDLALGRHQAVILDRALTIIDLPLHAPGPMEWTLMLIQDSTGGHAFQLADGYLVGAATTILDTGDTVTAIAFVNRPDTKQLLKTISTGVPNS